MKRSAALFYFAALIVGCFAFFCAANNIPQLVLAALALAGSFAVFGLALAGRI